MPPIPVRLIPWLVVACLVVLLGACGGGKDGDAPLTVEAYAAEACQGRVGDLLEDDSLTWGRLQRGLDDTAGDVRRLQPPLVLAEWHRQALLTLREMRGIAAGFPANDPIQLFALATPGLVALSETVTAIEATLPPPVLTTLTEAGCVEE